MDEWKTSYTRAAVEAEEAHELKRALSSQMVQLLFEQERKLEGHLRDCISFTDATGGRSSPRSSSPSGRGEGAGRRGFPAAAAAAAAIPTRVLGSAGSGIELTRHTSGQSSFGQTGEDDDFEKVEAWMVPGFEGRGGGKGGGDASGKMRDDGGGSGGSGDTSLLIPFATSGS